MTTPGAVSHDSHPALAGFRDPVRAWFGHSFAAPTRAQELGWPAIAAGASTLILAPTGSGKTLAAFLAAIDRVMFDPVPEPAARCRVLYISPLKALAVDIDRNLRAPLVGIARAAERLGLAFHQPAVAIRTGDTPSRERARFVRTPSDILITTPESLYLMLTSRARDPLSAVRWVIVDEIHTMVGTKRGAHLALSLERLEALAAAPLQRIGLSATVRPVDEAARFLGGCADGAARPVTVVDAGRVKPLDLTVQVAVEDMARLGEIVEIPDGPAAGERRTGIWPAIHPVVLDLIRRHRSTLIFVNSRRLAERLAAALNELAGETIVHAHHGSLAREQRLHIEERLKSGSLPALVATSSLELGIDMGAIDLVIQVEAPPSVASGIQRIGRAGHTLDAPSAGVILPKYRGDLLACAALVERMKAGAVEAIRYPRLPLDVLAQQIVAMVAMDDWRVDDLAEVLRRAAPFRDLSRGQLDGVLDMLAGRYPSDEFADLRPRVVWNRLDDVLRPREGAKRVAIENGGTIPDRGLYGVFLAGAPAGQGRVGELDEEMVFESRIGETFILGASTWRIEDITPDRVLVSPAAGEPGRMPFWHGDRPGRPLEFGRAIGALARTLRAMSEPAAVQHLTAGHALTETAARNLVQYLKDQVEAAGAMPDDRTLVVERFKDEVGDWRICLLSPFGGQVHGPWAMAVGALARRRYGMDLDLLWTDDGIVLRFPDVDDPPAPALLFPDPAEVEDLVIEQLGAGGGARQAQQGAPATALFASRFREAAGRALLLPRRFPGQRVPLWQQRKRAADLLSVAARFDAFPIVLETYRECLRDVFDIQGLRELLDQVAARAVRVVTVDSRRPSPFAAALLFTYVANFMYEGDAPLAEARAQALLVDPAQLRDLLGPVELRELLDPDALASLELRLQRLTPERAARHADALHDMLRDVGDLTEDEIRARVAEGGDLEGWLAGLERERRVARLMIAGEERVAAVEDVARYRDALGAPPPPGIPAAFLEPAPDPLGDLIGRYARTHGPFLPYAPARRFGLGVDAVLSALRALETAGRVVQGEFRPGATGREWCDAGVLRALRQRSLARLRQEVEPVEPPALGRFSLDWQGVTAKRRGREGLLSVIESLQGTTMPASVFERDILPARVEDYDPRHLDALTASGIVVWTGVEPLAPRDGRIRLLLAEHAPLLLTPSGRTPPDGPIHTRLRNELARRGALFFPQLLQAVGGGFVPDVLEALWDLVWAGEVTNDTLEPLRAYLRPRRRPRRPRDRSWQIERVRRPGLVGSGLGLPAEAAGRWSLVSGLITSSPTPAERLTALTRQLLDRHGVLTRDAVLAEGIEGGFTAVYGVLKAMEDAGRVRRGYFVAGRGGTQFALPGAVDRLRALREPPEAVSAVLVAATDPANPYGAALPWPERPPEATGRRPVRAAGAFVVLVDGSLAAWLSPRDGQLVTMLDAVSSRPLDETARAVAVCLADEVAAGRQTALFIREIDGRPAVGSPIEAALRKAGFAATSRGLVRRLPPSQSR
jgi:ATP-dependent Lhr-like helicase